MLSGQGRRGRKGTCKVQEKGKEGTIHKNDKEGYAVYAGNIRYLYDGKHFPLTCPQKIPGKPCKYVTADIFQNCP